MDNKPRYTVFFRTDFHPSPASLPPIVSVTLKDNHFNFNARAVEVMGLSVGMRLSYVEDHDNPRRFGFRITEDERGFEVRPRYVDRKTNVVVITSAPLVHHVIEKLGRKTSFRAQIGTQYDDGWWILESSVSDTSRNNKLRTSPRIR